MNVPTYQLEGNTTSELLDDSIALTEHLKGLLADEISGQQHMDFDDITDDELADIEAEADHEFFYGLEDDDYCKSSHNISMIDDIINNTLSQTAPLKNETADTLVKLGQLRTLLTQ